MITKTKHCQEMEIQEINTADFVIKTISKAPAIILAVSLLFLMNGCITQPTSDLSASNSNAASEVLSGQTSLSTSGIKSGNAESSETSIVTGASSIETLSSGSSEATSVFNVKLEAENAILNGVGVADDIPGYSGSGFVTGFDAINDSVVFKVSIPDSKAYDITIVSTSRAGFGEKTNDFSVNDVVVASFLSYPENAFSPYVIRRVYLYKGDNEIKISKSWGWFELDFISIKDSIDLSNSKYRNIGSLVNSNSTGSTKKVFQYLADNYGKRIITGQFSQKKEGPEIDAIKDVTGKYPAIRGFDLIEYSPTRVMNGQPDPKSVETAIAWWNAGGLVTYSWHWNAPIEQLKPGKEWWGAFYTDYTYFDLSKAVNSTNSDEYQAIIHDIDAISTQLAKLQDAGVPVLFRPLHEASGGWFWWGAKGKDAAIWLWKLMYERLTNYHKLNNLIWIWNGQKADWYPGDSFVDIIGEDIYAGDRNYASQGSKFFEAQNYTRKSKIVALTENASVPDVDLLIRDSAGWSFFATWEGDFVLKSDGKSYSEKSTEISILQKMYDSEYAITRDELPDFK